MKKIIVILIAILLTSCDKDIDSESGNSKAKKHEYDEINHAKINYFDVFSQIENEYYIYYYSETCYHCQGVKNEIIEFALCSKMPVYFVEVMEVFGTSANINLTVGATDPYSAFANQTPQLSLVKNKEIYYSINGDDIKVFLFTL